MADFHPEVEKEIEAGPQSICDQHIPVMRNESLEEFARRCVQRAVELEREECAKVCERVYLDASPDATLHVMQTAILAIRRRGRP